MITIPSLFKQRKPNSASKSTYDDVVACVTEESSSGDPTAKSLPIKTFQRRKLTNNNINPGYNLPSVHTDGGTTASSLINDDPNGRDVDTMNPLTLPSVSPPSPRPTPTMSTKLSPRKQKKSVQMFLNFGQKTLTPSPCPTCGCLYQKGVVDDERMHKKIHASFLKQQRGVVFDRWQELEIVWSGNCNGKQPKDTPLTLSLSNHALNSRQCIIRVPHHPSIHQLHKKIQKILNYIISTSDLQLNGIDLSPYANNIDDCSSDLSTRRPDKRHKRDGSNNDTSDDSRYHIAYVYLEESSALVIGCALIKKISGLNLRRNTIVESTIASGCPTVTIGVSMIWTHESYRRRGIASTLLDAVREEGSRFLGVGRTILPADIAFSSPTFEGASLAESYSGKTFVVF